MRRGPTLWIPLRHYYLLTTTHYSLWQLDVAKAHPLPLLSIPAHTAGCTYPMLHRLRLLPELDGTPEGARAEGGEGGGDAMTDGAESTSNPHPVGAAAVLGFAERTLLEEYTWMVVHGFCESHKDAAKMLGAFIESFSVEASGVYVEVP